MITQEITCPHCRNIVTIEYPEPQRRGKLASKKLKDMTNEELLHEYSNAQSLLYKAHKREAPIETIAKNDARLAAATEERERRGI